MVFSIPPERQTPFVHDNEPPICPCGHPNLPSVPAAAPLPYDTLQEIVDAAFPTGGTEGPNAWTDERIRVRTRFAEQLEDILGVFRLQATPPPEKDDPTGDGLYWTRPCGCIGDDYQIVTRNPRCIEHATSGDRLASC